MAGGPPVAERLGLSTFHFVNRQVLYLVPTIAILIAVSFLPLRHLRRLALVIYFAAWLWCCSPSSSAPRSRARIAGSCSAARPPAVRVREAGLRRHRRLGVLRGRAAQGHAGRAPRAFLLLPAHHRAADPAARFRPDHADHHRVERRCSSSPGCIGSGCSVSAASACVGVGAAYEFVPHVRARIERFLDKSSGDTFQVDTAMESFRQGGWLGKGPGEGSVKRILPDAHTDFIFAVTGEEFGIVVCLGLLLLFAFIVLRGLTLARRNDDPFCRLADHGPRADVRPPGRHQHGGQRASHAGQGHDAAVHLLRRLLAAVARARHGLPGRADAPAPALRSMLDRLAHRRRRADERSTASILLAAGGTGGHLFPAEALAKALAGARRRASRSPPTSASSAISRRFPAEEVIAIPSATPSGRPAAADGAGRAPARTPGRHRRRRRAAVAARPSWSASAATRPCRLCSRRRCSASRP